MPKAEKGTPKYLANKMKAKGLQKLRWYCEMCQKQCRDENGFKCHTTSESHQRQLLLFAENPHKYLDQFSKEFCEGFIELIRRRFGTKRVYANQVYQEYISDRNHLHMNATRWVSLGGFVQWLGRKGICTVDQTEKGWYVTWIDRDPETIARQVAGEKKKKMDKDDQERMLDFIDKQVERGKSRNEEETQYTELQKKSEDEIVVQKFDIKPAFPTSKPVPAATAASVFKEPASKRRHDDDTMSIKSSKSSSSSRSDGKKKLSALEEIRLEEERKKEWKKKKIEQQEYRDGWLTEGIVVKIMSKNFGDKYYKQKGVVVEVLRHNIAIVKLFEANQRVKVEDADLETVIPSLGREIKILKGKYRGSIAILKSLDMDHYCVDIEIVQGPNDGQRLYGIPYEEISKIYTDST